MRARVRQFRDHPALLAWYLNDELSLKYLPRLEAHRAGWLGENPDHPTWAVLYQVHDVAAYFNTFDVIGTDLYPIGRKPASMAAVWTAETFRQVAKSRPLWQVPQLHNWADYAKTPEDRAKGRTPTLAEKRSMAWQCICEGATGLVFYSWFDVLRNPDVLWLIAVNDGDGEGQFTFVLPAEVPSVTVVGEARAIRPEGRVFRDTLGRLALHIYEINWKSAER